MSVTSKYERYSKEELIRINEERDRKPKFGLVWERDEIDHDRSRNRDFATLDLVAEHTCGDWPRRNLLIEGDNFIKGPYVLEFLNLAEKRDRSGKRIETAIIGN